MKERRYYHAAITARCFANRFDAAALPLADFVKRHAAAIMIACGGDADCT